MPAALKAAAKAKATIDYPRRAEIIRSDHYAFRIAGPPDGRTMEVSIDGGSWQSCRAAAGYWWYDWQPVAGQHRVEARLTDTSGSSSTTEVRQFKVA